MRVKLVEDDVTLKRVWEVGLKSKRRKNLWSLLTIDPLESRLEAKIAFAGGALAEDQNEKYKDKHNPDEIAKLAVECYKDVVKKLEYGSSPTNAESAAG